MRRELLTIIAATGLALTTAACKEKEPVQPTEGVGAGEAWSSINGDANETSYSRLDQINTDNAGELGLKWSLDLPGEVSLEATPIEVDDTLYFTGSYAKVYAVDAKNGKILWTFDPETWKHDPAAMHLSFAANRGVAYADGKIYFAALDGRLFALDAKTGDKIWVTETVPEGVNAIVTGAPRVFDGKVIIGNGGADFGTRGYVTAYNAKTGKQAWRFYVVPGSPQQNKGHPALEAAAKTWPEDFWKTNGGGGGPWNAITFDSDLNQIYVATGNAAPYDPEVRSPDLRDNLYTASIIALDADTGKYVWHYQPVPSDSWDYDNTQQMTLADIKIDGKLHKVLMQAPKNGFFYVIDRTDGKLLNEPGKTTEITWAKKIDQNTGRPVENPNIHYKSGETEIWPGSPGGHNWQSMAYNPMLGLVYIPVQQIGARFKRVSQTAEAGEDANASGDAKQSAGAQPTGDAKETGSAKVAADAKDTDKAKQAASSTSAAKPEAAANAETAANDQQDESAFNVMGLLTEAVVQKPGDGHGFLVAWDPVAQKQVWSIRHDTLWNGGALTTAGGLVFQGTADGMFNVYNASTGERLWRFNAGLGIIAAPMTYTIDGKQYVSVLVGYGGTSAAFGKVMDAGWKFGVQPRRLLTFALGAKGKLPKSPGPTFKVNALDDPDLVLDPADVNAGRALSVRCAACHGVGLNATGAPGPDLRESAIALRLDTFSDLLKSGSLMDKGMPRFEMLSDDEIRELFAYIRKRARDALHQSHQAEEQAPRPKL